MTTSAFRRLYDSIRGTGAAAVTIPSMDGSLKPNNLLDAAEAIARLPAPQDMALSENAILVASGDGLFAIDRDSHTLVNNAIRRFDRNIVALATHPSGSVAVALESGEVHLTNGHGTVSTVLCGAEQKIPCITAITFGDSDTLFVCSGSSQNAKADWKRDLMNRNASGSVWRVRFREQRVECLAKGMAFPFGVAVRGGELLVSEAWKHRLLTIEPGRSPTQAIDNLPGYPSRIYCTGPGELWLCLFAPRRQMVEFVLRERAYCKRMMQEIPQEFWMAPAMNSGRSYFEPLQGGAIKQLGVLKPWAPTRSYGLVVKMNSKLEVVSSLHSRADGSRHGVTSCVDTGGSLIVASEGNDLIVSVDLSEGGELSK